MTAYYNEIDPFAAQWLRNLVANNLIAPGDVDERSIEDVSPDDLRDYTQCHFFAGIGVWSYALRLAGWPDDRPVWTGSCPCPPFSAAGKGSECPSCGGKSCLSHPVVTAGWLCLDCGDEWRGDDRHLLPEFIRLIGEYGPSVTFGEQVASRDGRLWLYTLRAVLETLGHAFGAADTCSAGSGAPHIRQRLRFVAERLEHAPLHGRIEWRPEPGERSLGGGRSPERLAHHHHQGLEGRFGEPERGAELAARPGSVDGGAADAGRSSDERCSGPGEASGTSGSPEVEARERQRCGSADRAGGALGGLEQPSSSRRGWWAQGNHVTPGDGENHSPSPTNGFWRDADWLFCRDGKWRPVESSYVEMADGAPSCLGRLCAAPGEEESETRLQALLGTFGEERVSEWAGSRWSLQEQEILRPHLYGGLDGRSHESGGCEEQPPPVGESRGASVRDMREVRLPSLGASPRREPDEQRTVEFTDVVRLLPRSLSLAELCGRRRDADQLHILQRAIREERGVPYASESLEEAWASLSEETQARIRLGFDAGAWRRVVPFPLARGAESRVGRLRAYGNAVDAQATKHFIEAYSETGAQ